MPLRLCSEGGCNEQVAYKGRCRRHARANNHDTHRNRHVYNSARWRNTRARQLADHPLCSVCMRVADQVDHVVPIEKGGDIWSFDNLQSLCAYHHGKKTRMEQL